MAARKAAQLAFNLAPAYPTPPTVPNAPGAALTRKAETPSAPPPGGFTLARSYPCRPRRGAHIFWQAQSMESAGELKRLNIALIDELKLDSSAIRYQGAGAPAADTQR
jgi:hypothetical protein